MKPHGIAWLNAVRLWLVLRVWDALKWCHAPIPECLMGAMWAHRARLEREENDEQRA